MSLSILHVKHARLLYTGHTDIETARQDVENNRSGNVIDFWAEHGPGDGFLYEDVQWHSVFLVSGGLVYEVRLYRQWPID